MYLSYIPNFNALEGKKIFWNWKNPKDPQTGSNDPKDESINFAIMLGLIYKNILFKIGALNIIPFKMRSR